MEQTAQNNGFKDFLDTIPRWVRRLIIIGTALLLVLIAWGTVNSIRNECINQETRLSAQYRSNQNHLSSFISEFKETVGIADRKTDQLDRVLVDAVQGRYGDAGFNSNGALMNAITEAYPNLQGVDIYDKVIDTIQAGREDFKTQQDKLLDQIRVYNSWRGQGIIRSWALSGYAPSSHLEARVGDTVLTGQAALDKMGSIVLIKDATKAFETGEMDSLQAPTLPARTNNNTK